jgi:hypothetical protein
MAYTVKKVQPGMSERFTETVIAHGVMVSTKP